MRHRLLVLFFFCSLPVSAMDKSCLLDKYTQYAITQKKWQKDFSEIIIQADKGLDEYAKFQLKDQLTRIEKRLLAVKILLDSSPEKLEISKEVNFWLQLDKSEEKEFAKQNVAYNKLLNKVKAYHDEVSQFDGAELHKFMRTKIIPSADFKLLYSDFKEKVIKINSIKCDAI